MMSKKNALRRAVIGASALAVAFGMIGCSSAAPEAPEATQEGEVVTIKLMRSPVFYEPVFIAMEEGLFEKAGLNVEISENATAAESVPQLLNGNVDIAMTGGVSLIQAVAEGVPIKAVLGQSSADPDVCTSGIMTTSDSGLSGYADLGGTTIGLQGLKETTHLGTLLAAKDAGVDTDSIDFVQLPLPNLNEAVANGTVDAAFPIGMFFSLAAEQGLVQIGCPIPEYLPWGPNVIYAATNDYIENNADTIQRFQEVIAEATEIGVANNFERIRQVQLENSNAPEEFILNGPISPYLVDLHRSGFEVTSTSMEEFGFISAAPTFDDLVASIAITK